MIFQNNFAHLNTDKSAARWPDFTRHRAPHKPLLLLSVIDLFAQGSIPTNLIELTPELGELFTLYWSRVFPPHTEKRGNIAMPFYHLQSDGFWQLIPRPGQEAILAGSSKIHAVSRLRELSLGAKLDDGLFRLLQTENGRFQLRETLIQTYFIPPIQENLRQQTAINLRAHQYSLDLLDAKLPTIDETRPEYQPVRDQGFRRAVTAAYDHRCAFCRIRIRTADGHTAIEAAHIIPWAISHNDNIHNGLALCRLCHWAFDEGLLTVGKQYHILTSRQLQTSENFPGHLTTLQNRPIFTPAAERHHPHPENLAWHHRHAFRPH